MSRPSWSRLFVAAELLSSKALSCGVCDGSVYIDRIVHQLWTDGREAVATPNVSWWSLSQVQSQFSQVILVFIRHHVPVFTSLLDTILTQLL